MIARLAVVATVGFALLLPYAAAASVQPRPAVLIVMAPGLRSEDLTYPDLQAITRLREHAAVGWIITRTAAKAGPHFSNLASGLLTIGSGSRALADEDSHYRGSQDLAALRTANERLDHTVPIGALGDVCRRAHLRIYVYGGLGGVEPNRGALLLAMDPAGRVDHYESARQPDVRAPYGVRTDISRLPSPEPGALTVWMYSDIMRAETYAHFCLGDIARGHRRQALRVFGRLLTNRLIPAIEQAHRERRPLLVILTSPTPSRRTVRSDRLAPLMISGAGFEGSVYSRSTHRSGIALNTDILPTVAGFLRVAPAAQATGRALISHGPSTSIPEWQQQHDQTLLVSRLQIALGGLPQLRLAITLIMALLLLISRWIARPVTTLRLATCLGAALLAFTALQTVSSLFQPLTVETGRLLAVVIAATAILVYLIAPRKAAALSYGLVTVIATLVAGLLALYPDGLGKAWLSYNVMYGTRMYGIGNEMAGVWLAATIITIQVPLWQRYRRIAAGLLALATALAVLPWAGADMGAGLTLAVMAAYTGTASLPRRRRMVALPVILTLGIVMLGLVLAITDRGPDASHLGRALAADSGLWQMMLRKIALNIDTTVRSTWAITLASSLAGIAWIGRSSLSDGWRSSIQSLYIGTAVIYLVNDTGVVAAALSAGTGFCALALAAGAVLPKTPEAQRVRDH